MSRPRPQCGRRVGERRSLHLGETEDPLALTGEDRRCTASAVDPPASIIATFAPRTASPDSDVRSCPMPSATPRYADAGIVVTEIATPTAELARVSTASMPATP